MKKYDASNNDHLYGLAAGILLGGMLMPIFVVVFIMLLSMI